MPKFPAPTVNSVPDSDPMVKKVDLDYMEIASRQSAMPKDVKNDMVVKHVKQGR